MSTYCQKLVAVHTFMGGACRSSLRVSAYKITAQKGPLSWADTGFLKGGGPGNC